MIRQIRIEGYLTQRKLSDALQQIVGLAWVGDEVRIPGSRRRWDMAFRSDSGLIVVEYDGDTHYCNSIRIKMDREKDMAAKESGQKVVRFPYWIQLDQVTLKHYFNLSAEIEQDFPQGFITTKVFPASFCEMGIERFRMELDSLPTIVSEKVVASLRERAKEYGAEYVLPSALTYLLNSLIV